MSNPKVLAEKALAQAGVSNEISKRLQSLLEKNAANSSVVQAKVTEAIDALVTNERIFDHQKQAVAEKIASVEGGHAACMELIRDLACHRNSAEIDTIGSPVGQEKTARARSTGAAPADWDEAPGGDAFRQRLCGN